MDNKYSNGFGVSDAGLMTNLLFGGTYVGYFTENGPDEPFEVVVEQAYKNMFQAAVDRYAAENESDGKDPATVYIQYLQTLSPDEAGTEVQQVSLF